MDYYFVQLINILEVISLYNAVQFGSSTNYSL